MWIAIQPTLSIGNAHQIEHLSSPCPSGLAIQALMNTNRLADLRADGVHGIKRSHGFLKHHGDSIAAHLAHISL